MSIPEISIYPSKEIQLPDAHNTNLGNISTWTGRGVEILESSTLQAQHSKENLDDEVKRILSLHNDLISQVREFIDPIEYVVTLVQNGEKIPYYLQRLSDKVTLLDLSKFKLTGSQTANVLTHFGNIKALKMPMSVDPHQTENLNVIQTISNLKNLCDLDMSTWTDNSISNRTLLTDDMLITLVSNRKFTRLNIANSRNITARGLTHLAELRELKYLNLRCSGLQNECLYEVAKITSLIDLDIGSNLNISDQGISSLETLVNLRSINLRGLNRVSNDSLKIIEKLVNLECLDLSNCFDVTGHILYTIKDHAKLKILSLNHISHLEDIELQNLPSPLQHLNLSGCKKITLTGLAHLTRLLELEHINIIDCINIGDDILTLLPNFTNLKSIKTYGTSITIKAAQEMERTIPNLKVNITLKGYVKVKLSQITNIASTLTE